MAILKLADKHSIIRLEAACKKALTYTPRPSYKNIQTILQTGQDKVVAEEISTPVTNENTKNFGFTRGSNYYGGNEQ